MMRSELWQVVFAGEGGQGLVMAGLLLAEAASLCENKWAAQTQSYGIAARGGFTKSEVVISDEEIVFPGVENPDVVVALTPEAYDKYRDTVSAEAWLFYDSGIIPETGDGEARINRIGLPFTDAAKGLGRVGAANIVALGAVVAVTGIVNPDSMEKAINERFHGQVGDMNRRAFQAGRNLIEMT